MTSLNGSRQSTKENMKRDELTTDQDSMPTPVSVSLWKETRDRANDLIISYLKATPLLARLAELRDKGWQNPKGDEHFQRQRHTADTANERRARQFYIMMQKIGDQLHENIGVFRIAPFAGLKNTRSKILDFCMAPGGMLDTALKHNPHALAFASTLPPENGGHRVFLGKRENVDIKYRDITMLTGDMGVTELPHIHLNHPDAEKFLLSTTIKTETRFDLIICDGHVLRTHERAPYRALREPMRLITTQLAIGLEHLRPGGTMLVRLHRAEEYDTLSLIYTFSKFATIQLFKPSPWHATRSSFYMIATIIQSSQPEALREIQQLKALWRAATFEDEEGFESALQAYYPDAQAMIDDFGSEFVKLATQPWTVQDAALATASFTQ